MSCCVLGCRWEASQLAYPVRLELTDPEGVGDLWTLDLELELCPEHGRELHEAEKAISIASERLAEAIRDRRFRVEAEDDDDLGYQLDDEELSDDLYDILAEVDDPERELEMAALADDPDEDETPF